MATEDRERSFLMRTCTHPAEGTTTWTCRVGILTKMDSLTTGAQLDMPTVCHVTGKIGRSSHLAPCLGTLGSLLLPGEDGVHGAEPKAWSGAAGRRHPSHPEGPIALFQVTCKVGGGGESATPILGSVSPHADLIFV